MIKIEHNIVNNSECDELISWYQTNQSMSVRYDNNNVYRFEGIDILQKLYLFSVTEKILGTAEIDRIRIQHVDKEIDVVEEFHSHVTPYSFIIFLNDDFEGGELIFNNITIKPKKGQMVYFSGEEKHYVKRVTNGHRYSLVCFLKSKLKFEKNTMI